MSIIENPVIWLIGALCVLAFLLIVFKITNYLEEKNFKTKGKDKKKEETPAKSDAPLKEDKQEEKEIQSDYFNYLYDRFVISPTCDDSIKIKSISDAFISQEECDCIKHNKVHIDVTPVKIIESSGNSTDVKSIIENIISENKTSRSKLLEEFDGLSREMKLLLIENIMSRK